MTKAEGLQQLHKPTLLVSVFGLGTLALTVVTQMAIAALFGAGAELDALLAANALPQYLVAVVSSALGFVLVPVFVGYAAGAREREAAGIAGAVVLHAAVVLGGVAAMALVFRLPLVRLFTPHLRPDSQELAGTLALVIWPLLPAACIVATLASLAQARESFGWPAAAPALGGVVSLAIMVALADRVGVMSVALGVTAGAVVQVVTLGRKVFQRERLEMRWWHPGLPEVARLLMPLILANVTVRCTVIVDRYLASGLATGSISHLDYAYKLVVLLSAVISTGLATAVFPRMARNVTDSDLGALVRTVSLSLRLMWLAVAPAIALGSVLALPLVATLFRRGQFTGADALAVAGLFQIYLLALVAMCLGNITGRTFYVLRDTRTIALLGTIEALAYAVYTPLLAWWLGVLGVALGYVIYFDLSLSWHLLFIRHRLARNAGRTLVRSFASTIAAAAIGGAAAWVGMNLVLGAWLQLIVGATVGLLVYGALVLAPKGEGRALLRHCFSSQG